MSELLENLQNAVDFALSGYLDWEDGAEVMLEAKAQIKKIEAENAALRTRCNNAEDEGCRRLTFMGEYLKTVQAERDELKAELARVEMLLAARDAYALNQPSNPPTTGQRPSKLTGDKDA